MNMKIFIDTADLDEIKEAQKWGIIESLRSPRFSERYSGNDL